MIRSSLVFVAFLLAVGGCIAPPPNVTSGDTDGTGSDVGVDTSRPPDSTPVDSTTTTDAPAEDDSADDGPSGPRWHVLFENTDREKLMGFPVLVRVPADRVGDSFRFVDADGTPLPHEIDTQSVSEIDVWVRVPQIAADSSEDFIVLDDSPDSPSPAEVWSDHTAVYHFSSDSGDAIDSTGSFPAVANMTPERTDGVIGRSFDPRLGYFTVGMDDAFRPMATEALTVEAWFYTDGTGGHPVWHEGACVGWFVRVSGTDLAARLGTGIDCNDTNYWEVATEATVVDGRWHHVALVMDRTTTPGSMRLFVDGERGAQTTIGDDRPIEFNSFIIGRVWDGTQPFGGLIDEVRVAPHALSGAWFSAHVANLRGQFTRWELR